MLKWAALSAAVLVLAGCLVAVYGFGPSDDQMIYAALQESIAASREGRPYGVLEKLASGFSYNGDSMIDRAAVARAIRDLKPAVVIPSRDLRVEASEASLSSSASITWHGGSIHLDRVDVVFKKSTGVRWAVFPYPQWKVASVKAEGFDPQAVMAASPF